MANVNVTYQELESTATRLTAGQGELEDTLTQLKGLVDDLVGAGFQTDQASGAFATAYDEFTTGAKSTISGLEGLSAFLKSAAEQYSATDDALASAIRG